MIDSDDDDDVVTLQKHIDEYHRRKDNFATSSSRSSAFSAVGRMQRDTVRKYDVQPEWLKNGTHESMQLYYTGRDTTIALDHSVLTPPNTCCSLYSDP